MPAPPNMKKGFELYKQLSKRDYSGSESDQYAQLVGTLFSHFKSDLFPLLEKAEKEGKKLVLKSPEGVFISHYTQEHVSFV